MPVDRRRPRLGYLLATVAALMFAVIGSIGTLAALQIAGGVLVVAAVACVQAHPPAPEVEAVPIERGLEAPTVGAE